MLYTTYFEGMKWQWKRKNQALLKQVLKQLLAIEKWTTKLSKWECIVEQCRQQEYNFFIDATKYCKLIIFLTEMINCPTFIFASL